MAYHPMGNTAIESSHFQIKTILQASRGRQPTSLWTVAVRGAVRTLNSLQHPLTGLTPNFLYYGRETTLPLASLVSPPRPDSDPLTPQGRVIQLAQQSVKYLVQQRCGTEVLQRRRIHLGNMSHPLYPLTSHVGQSVMVCDTSELRNHQSRSLAPRWTRPWLLIAAINNVVGSLQSDFKHKLDLPETVKLLGINRLLPVPKGLRWEEINTLTSFSREARYSILEQGWSSIYLFGEILEGADPMPRLHQLGMSPAEVNQSYEEADCEGRDEDEHEEGREDPFGEGGLVPGGREVDSAPALLPAPPEAGHCKPRSGSIWTPGVALDPTDLTVPQPSSPAGVSPPQVPIPVSGPHPRLVLL